MPVFFLPLNYGLLLLVDYCAMLGLFGENNAFLADIKRGINLDLP